MYSKEVKQPMVMISW